MVLVSRADVSTYFTSDSETVISSSVGRMTMVITADLNSDGY